jgi:hypothetical protein
MFSRTLSTLLDSSKSGMESGSVDAIAFFGSAAESDTGRVTYRSFRFRPDGSTDLPKNEQWYLTLVADEGASPTPKNFFCLQIDPFNGTIRDYQP